MSYLSTYTNSGSNLFTFNLSSGAVSTAGNFTAPNLVYNSGDQTVAGVKTFSNNIIGNGTHNTLPNQALSSNSSIVTRALFDSILLDPNVIYFKDDFISVFDSVNSNVGELGWNAIYTNGTGNVRPYQINNSTFGVVGLQPPIAYRGANVLTWDVSNAIGGGGFIFSNNGLEKSSTVLKFRFQFNSLSSSVGAGFGGYTSSAYKQNRFFGLRYAKASSAWTASTAITLNEYRRPTVANGRRYYASVAGTTGGSEPTWPTTAGGTVVDGGVTWTENGLDGASNFVLQECPNTADEYISTIVDTGIVAATNTWYNVVMTYVSGATWNFTINGTNVGNLTMTTTNRVSNMLPVFKIESSSTSVMYLSVDYFIMFSRGIIR